MNTRRLVESQGPVIEDNIQYTINTYIDGIDTIVEAVVHNLSTDTKIVKEHRCLHPTTFGMDVDDIQAVNDMIDIAINEVCI